MTPLHRVISREGDQYNIVEAYCIRWINFYFFLLLGYSGFLTYVIRSYILFGQRNHSTGTHLLCAGC